jgi:hypothetical protein
MAPPPGEGEADNPGSSEMCLPPEKHLGLGRMLPPPPQVPVSASGMLPPPPPEKHLGVVFRMLRVVMIIDSVIGVSTTSSTHSTPSVSMPCPNEAASVVAGSGNVAAAPNVIDIDDDNGQSEIGGTGKRWKRCTSFVWDYFTKKVKIVEVDGKTYKQLWGHCNFPKCKAHYRAESHEGTSGFISHLKTIHSVVKGQQQLMTEKDHDKDVTVIQTYKYD